MQRKLLVATLLAAVVAAALIAGSKPFTMGQERIPTGDFCIAVRAAEGTLHGCRLVCLAGLSRGT